MLQNQCVNHRQANLLYLTKIARQQTTAHPSQQQTTRPSDRLPSEVTIYVDGKEHVIHPRSLDRTLTELGNGHTPGSLTVEPVVSRIALGGIRDSDISPPWYKTLLKYFGIPALGFVILFGIKTGIDFLAKNRIVVADRRTQEVVVIDRNGEPKVTRPKFISEFQVDIRLALGQRVCGLALPSTAAGQQEGKDERVIAGNIRAALRSYLGKEVEAYSGSMSLETLFRIFDYLATSSNALRYSSTPAPWTGRLTKTISDSLRGGNCLEMAKSLITHFEFAGAKTEIVLEKYEDTNEGHAYVTVRVSALQDNDYIKKKVRRLIAVRYPDRIAQEIKNKINNEEEKQELLAQLKQLEKNGKKIINNYEVPDTKQLDAFLSQLIYFQNIKPKEIKNEIASRTGIDNMELDDLATRDEIERRTGTYLLFDLQMGIPGQTRIGTTQLTAESCRKPNEIPSHDISLPEELDKKKK